LSNTVSRIMDMTAEAEYPQQVANDTDKNAVTLHSSHDYIVPPHSNIFCVDVCKVNLDKLLHHKQFKVSGYYTDMIFNFIQV